MSDLSIDTAGNISLTANRSGSIKFQITASGSPVDLTGSTARLVVKKAPKDLSSIIDWTSQFSHNSTGGELTPTVAPSDTVALDDSLKEASASYTYQLILTLGDQTVTTLRSGTFTLVKSFV